MKKIDIGNGTFEKLITTGNLYVDKTKYLYDILSSGSTYFFLSRPRRFGKTLTVSTLEAICKGQRDLFKGLYIDSTDYEWKEYPVIHIDFSQIEFESIEGLKVQIKNTLLHIAEQYHVALSQEYAYNEVLKYLVDELAKRGKVVVLVDEYDSVLTNNLDNAELESIRDVLKGFYTILKSQSGNLRLCFITGVTKFSKVSIFSAMNNLTDISMDEGYATMLGYTQEELESYFADYIDEGIQKRGETRESYLASIKRWYDGYTFAPNCKSVYNPVSVGSFFLNGGKAFKNYWVSTGGTPYLLTKIAGMVGFDLSLDTDMEVSDSTLQGVDLVQMVKTEVSKGNFLSLLYQTGYLTIRGAELVEEDCFLKLGYPNEEVERGLNEILLPLYMGKASKDFSKPLTLKFFREGKVDEAMETLKAVYASIPYHELVFNAESACHASFMAMMRLMGADILGEEPTNKGRIDALLACSERIYVVEFKYGQSAEDAIAQIRKKGYYEKYLSSGKEIHLLGINFSPEERNIVEWKDETL